MNLLNVGISGESLVECRTAGYLRYPTVPNHHLLCGSITMARATLPDSFIIAKEKRCCACLEVKPAAEFHRSRHHSGGLVAKCKECLKIYKATKWENREECIARGVAAQRQREREFRERDPEGFAKWQYEKHLKHHAKHGAKINARRKRLRAENPEIKEKWNAARTRWAKQHPERVKELAREHRLRTKDDPKIRLDNAIMCGFWRCLRGQPSPGSWEKLVGYTVHDLKKRLLETMPEGYTWDDYLSGKLWIDHIRPKSSFAYQTADDADFRICYALNNLQLLTEEANRRKHASLPEAIQPSFSSI